MRTVYLALALAAALFLVGTVEAAPRGRGHSHHRHRHGSLYRYQNLGGYGGTAYHHDNDNADDAGITHYPHTYGGGTRYGHHHRGHGRRR